MLSRRGPSAHLILVILCCLVPLAALGATLFLNTPVAITALAALLVLIPLAQRLLTVS